jgi:hypothetical protein
MGIRQNRLDVYCYRVGMRRNRLYFQIYKKSRGEKFQIEQVELMRMSPMRVRKRWR